jgi:hypothetical protein
MGVITFTWTLDAKRAAVTWWEGEPGPLAELGDAAMPVRNPERFGWKQPTSGKQAVRLVQQVAQQFADQLQSDNEEES